MDRNFLNDVYKDFFGENGGKGNEADSPFPPKEPAGDHAETGTPVKENQTPVPETSAPLEPPAGEDEALRHAQEAIEEAKKLFDRLASAQKGTEDYLDASFEKMEDIRKEVMKDFGLSGKEELPDAESADTLAAETEKETEESQEPEEDPMETLDGLIGLTTIKRDVRELMDFVSVQKMRNEEGLKSVPVSLHLVFTGNPGTGKTTVARIIGKLYKNIGVLSKGQLIEVDRSGLVAGYVGQTALKTQDKIQEARGGVLFIDEAYSLAQKDDAFGQEAIDTILKAMEDYRDDFVVIVAGYTKPMEKFINSNPGLKSRFNKYIEFPDYTVDELMDIFYMNCRKYDYSLEEEAAKHIRELITAAKLEKQENFANAREVRNLFEKVITAQARRVKGMEQPTHEDMMTLRMEDLPIRIGEDKEEEDL